MLWPPITQRRRNPNVCPWCEIGFDLMKCAGCGRQHCRDCLHRDGIDLCECCHRRKYQPPPTVMDRFFNWLLGPRKPYKE